MQQVLFRIPLDSDWCFGPVCVPGFGWGLVLGLWSALGLLWLWWNRAFWIEKSNRLILPAAIWGGIAFVAIMLPEWVHLGTDARLTDAKQRLKNSPSDSTAHAKAHADRDREWRRRRLFKDAITGYEDELKANPRSVLAQYRLAWILATAPKSSVRNGKRAVELAQQAVASRRNAVTLDVLAAAHAENGDYDTAIKIAGKAAAIGGRSRSEDGEPGNVGSIRKRMQRYKSGKRYRDLNAGRSLPLYGYGFMMFLGFVLAGWTSIRRGRLVGIAKDDIWDACLWVLVGGIGGARLWYTVQYRAEVFKGREGTADYLLALVNLQDGGLVLYGGILGALTAFIVFCLRRKLNWLLMTDVIMPSFFLGLAFGRLGCFMNGCCYGDRCELPWGVTFPLGSVPDVALVDRGFLDAAQSVTIELHPSQIYSALNALLLATLMHCYFFIRNRDGSVLALALLTYPVTRFLIEFLRADEMGKFDTALTISQWFSLCTLVAGVAYAFWLARRPAVLTPVRVAGRLDETSAPQDQAS